MSPLSGNVQKTCAGRNVLPFPGSECKIKSHCSALEFLFGTSPTFSEGKSLFDLIFAAASWLHLTEAAPVILNSRVHKCILMF